MAQKLENRWNITDSMVLFEVVATYRPFSCCGHSVSGHLKSFAGLAVHKQSFLNLLRQNGRRVTKVC